MTSAESGRLAPIVAAIVVSIGACASGGAQDPPAAVASPPSSSTSASAGTDPCAELAGATFESVDEYPQAAPVDAGSAPPAMWRYRMTFDGTRVTHEGGEPGVSQLWRCAERQLTFSGPDVRDEKDARDGGTASDERVELLPNGGLRYRDREYRRTPR